MQGKLWVGVTILFALVMGNTTAFADEVNHFICRSATIRPAVWTDDLKLFVWDDNGVIVGQQEKSAFHAMNSQCVGVTKREKGKKGSMANGYCNYSDKDGDLVALQWAHPHGGPRKWSFIAGTGKWTGITGGGVYNTAESGVRTKPQTKGTFQSCVHVTGTYEVPKK